jgi:hypothetical protein
LNSRSALTTVPPRINRVLMVAPKLIAFCAMKQGGRSDFHA